MRFDLPQGARQLGIRPLQRGTVRLRQQPLQQRHLHQEHDERPQVATILDASEKAEPEHEEEQPEQDPERGQQKQDRRGEHRQDGTPLVRQGHDLSVHSYEAVADE